MLTKQSHRRCKVKINENTLNDILALISEISYPTRKAVALASGYSEVTVGKVFQAIYASDLAIKDIRKPSDGGRISAHMKYSDKLNFIIIDISSRLFTISLAASNYKILFNYSHTYSDSLRFEENFTIFLNDGIRHLCQMNASYSACVVISESEFNPCRKNISSSMPLKSFDSAYIKQTVSDILGYPPEMVITPDKAVKQYLLSFHGTDSSYILIGRTLSMYYLSKAKNLTVCRPWNTIVDNTPMEKYLGTSAQNPNIFSATAKLVNVLDSTFAPKTIVIQSDSLGLGSLFKQEIQSFLGGIYHTDAKITSLDSSSTAQMIGAVAYARNWLIKHLIISYSTQKKNRD
ncbi:MAG: hypothetical protein E7667_01600 [Ruminococcaceae bacterium]|nr:hypothetical protein [Oscillospiraceae bacterium]